MVRPKRKKIEGHLPRRRTAKAEVPKNFMIWLGG
jgi:hypothetical protein